MQAQVKHVSYVCFLAIPMLWNPEIFAPFQCIFPNSESTEVGTLHAEYAAECSLSRWNNFQSSAPFEKLMLLRFINLHHSVVLSHRSTTKRPSNFRQDSSNIPGPLETQECMCGLWVRLPNFSCPAPSFAGKKGDGVTPRKGMKHW